MADISGWDKRRLCHPAHEQITDPSGVFTVGLIPLLRFRVLWVGKFNRTCLLKDVEHRDPVLAGCFHANFRTFMIRQPFRKITQSFGKGRETLFEVFCTAVGIGNTDAGTDPGFVDIESTAIFTNDFKWQPETSWHFIVARLTVTSHPARSSRFRKR